MANKLYIIGIGPGDKDYIYPAANKRIEESDVLIGGRRNLDLFLHLEKEEVIIKDKLADIARYILENVDKKKMAVLASGDPGVFSISEYLKSKLGDMEMLVYPGISSFQYLCAKIHKSWDDAFIASLHGRELHNLSDVVKKHGKVILFTGGSSSPASVCSELVRDGLGDVKVTVGEKLSYPEERIVTGSPDQIGRLEFDSLSIMLLENPFPDATLHQLRNFTPGQPREFTATGQPQDFAAAGQPQEFTANGQPREFTAVGQPWEFATPGIPDELFVRGDVPMTKEEIRAAALSKLRLREDSVVYDIGAGTGSVSIECGLTAKRGKVYAIEKEQDALALIRANVLKFKPGNVTIVDGTAPDILAGLPKPDRIFIGGTDGRMDSILDWVAKIDHRIRIVVNAVAVETACEALEGLNGRGFGNIDITGVSVSKGRLAGKKHLMQAQNPIYIISAEK